MKKYISILLIGAVVFLTSCGFHSTSEEKRSDLQNNVSKWVDEQIDVNCLIVEEEATKKEYIVYRTRTGKKYHSTGCQYLSQSCIEITLENA